ncbi:hypothetical protein BKA65DRAFT_564853 [Rhexocercosporidium sp. MPI-PUGE-AT-0058]|nr:hypothetical protein BKA65DRAFT_564853 [Rhexocercosporidium sp. MPI-PUGE-AT-0058]
MEIHLLKTSEAARHASSITVSNSAEPNTKEATRGTSVPELGSAFEMASLSHQPREPQLPCYMLDSNTHNVDFFGRQDIFDLIDEKLLPSKTKLISSESVLMKQFALCGLGGVGRTEIAAE